MDGGHVHTQADRRVNRFAGGVRDVVEFEVEKDAGTEGLEVTHDRGAFRGEELEADLEQAALAGEWGDKALRRGGIRRVDGDDDFFFGGVVHSRIDRRGMSIDAPAKVNLVLRVLGKREDGFHAIETLMAPVSLADVLEIELGGDGLEFSCSDKTLPLDGSNLVCRAVEVFRKRTGFDGGVRVHLEKRIPHGAGLGGGSSDAAAVLRGVNGLVGAGLEVSDLEELAAGLGSDVPFFVRGVPAWCRGRGEIVEPIGDELPGAELLLVKPPFPVPTAWAYAAWARGGFPATSGGRLGSIGVMNDLEGPVFSKYLVLPVLKEWLGGHEGVAAAMMSGSGSTMIAFLNDGAAGLEERVRVEFGETFAMFRCRLGTAGGV